MKLNITIFCTAFVMSFLFCDFACKKKAKQDEALVRIYTNHAGLEKPTIEFSATNSSAWGRIESNTVRAIYGSNTEPKPTVEFKFTPQSELIPPSKFSNAPTTIPQERLLLSERFLEALKAAKLGWTGRAIWDDFAVVSNMVWESFYMSDEQFNRIYGTNTASTIKAITNRAPVNLRVIGGYFDGPPVVDPPYTWRTDINWDGFRSEIYSNYMRILNEPRPHQFDNQQSR